MRNDGYFKSNTELLVLVSILVAFPLIGKTAPANDRTAAYHRSITTMTSGVPNSALLTYAPNSQLHLLAKLVPGIEISPDEILWASRSTEVKVEDFPGGIVATFILGEARIRVEMMPLTVGREASKTEGGVLYTISTEPSTPLVVKCGEIPVSNPRTLRATALKDDLVGCAGASATAETGSVVLSSTKHPFAVVLTTSGSATTVAGDGDQGQIAHVRFGSGDGHLLLGFAENAARASEIAAINSTQARKAVADTYDNLFRSKIETPDETLNGAFRAALVTLEYNWLAPYGWIESVRHWPMMWHMQAAAGADWVGQTDRSRSCALAHAKRMLPTGAAPQLTTEGKVHREIFTAGSNHFYSWQLRHYLKATNNKEAIKLLAPVLDGMIEQSYDEFDRDGNGLLAWGMQIGNQEDYVYTPHDGTTPSVEGIQMLRARAEVARWLKDDDAERKCAWLIARAEDRLRSELWQPDLGRFMYFKDALGQPRPEGQYHTLTHPVIFDVLDPLDAWTSTRHLHDRLMGKAGEVYASNNFPEHGPSTSGVQAGAAQQPWGAWALAKAGRRNEAWLPLKAVAEWVMGDGLDGAWPEVSGAHPAADYFSPPAGLFIASTVEALFGLQVNTPDGYLEVAPSFPDDWPTARLNLPEYSAEFSRNGNRLEYRVDSKSRLRRRLRWALPPCDIAGVLVNGKPVTFKLIPGVDCVILTVDTPPATQTRFSIDMRPLDYRVEHPASVAEGDRLAISFSGCTVVGLDDRCGVLSGTHTAAGSSLHATVEEGMLKPYQRFGRLGAMNFSRRTFFVSCASARGTRFWHPVDLTILPRHEVAPRGEITLDDEQAAASFTIRNNTLGQLQGQAGLQIAGCLLPLDVTVAPRSEEDYSITIPREQLGLLSPGDNLSTLVLPNGESLELTLVFSKIYATHDAMKANIESRIVALPLPEEICRADDTERDRLRSLTNYDWVGLERYIPNTSDLVGKGVLEVAQLSGVRFITNERKWAPVSWKSGRSSVTLDLGGGHYRKFYLLVTTLMDSSDMFVDVARVTVRGSDGTLISRTLSSPGDLDWGWGQRVAGLHQTALKPRANRHGLLPLLSPEDADWAEAKPPMFPQPAYWASSLVHKTPSAVFSVVEIPANPELAQRTLTIESLGVEPTLALVAVSADMVETPERISVAIRPPFEACEPRVLFPLDTPADLAGWRLEGDAFSVSDAFGSTTLNSHAASGETATGRVISPSFLVGERMRSLVFKIQGGRSLADDGAGALDVRLVDAETSEMLERYPATETHVLSEIRVPLESHRGRSVQLEVVDSNSNTTFAWIGAGSISIIEELASPALATDVAEHRFPKPLFNLNQTGNLEGWTQERKTFSISRVADQWSLNSEEAAGPNSTGTASSPKFVLEGDFLKFLIHGGGSAVDEGPGALNVSLVDAESGEVLARVFSPAPGQRIFHRIQLPISKWKGRAVQLVIRDESPGGGLAWIGIRDVVLTENP